ncbi:MAG: hypothetical protein ACLQDY_19715 [Streptosporangiaceae bacterium]
MPCYRCGTRQVDPDRGESPWQRGVRDNRQVLICPQCQSSFDWTSDLDSCTVCASVRLVRRLGEVECRDCGSVGAAHAAGSAAAGGMGAGTVHADPGSAPGLAEEVELALAKVLGRAGRPAGIS